MPEQGLRKHIVVTTVCMFACTMTSICVLKFIYLSILLYLNNHTSGLFDILTGIV